MTVITKSRVLLALLVVVAGCVGQTSVGGYFIPGDPKAGMKVFFEKGCARCHSVLGEGGRSAPDLARTPAGHLSSAELLGAMWNHAPAMWEKMRAEQFVPPKFADAEMSNLFAFLYSVRSLDEPGDAQRGKQLFRDKHCAECHGIAKPGRGGPDLASWSGYRNPVTWIQVMWNHAPAMEKVLANRGIRRPEFQDRDLSDLMAYVRSQSSATRSRVYLRPADAGTGQKLFVQKGCANCHSIGQMAARRGPNLQSADLPKTLGAFAARMWNHGAQMSAAMRQLGVARPQFTNAEMADLIAYLFLERYFEPQGNRERGRRLFRDKHCSECHEGGGRAPDLSRSAQQSPVSLATSFWNHGPVMMQVMKDKNVPWPRFQPGEITDLLSYLKALQQPATARVQP